MLLDIHQAINRQVISGYHCNSLSYRSPTVNQFCHREPAKMMKTCENLQLSKLLLLYSYFQWKYVFTPITSRASSTVISYSLPFNRVIDCRHMTACLKSPPDASTISFRTLLSAFRFSSLHIYSSLTMLFSSLNGLKRNFVQREVIGLMIRDR